MKKLFLLPILCLFVASGLSAQTTRGTLKISDLKIVEANDVVTVAFNVEAPAKTVKRQYTLITIPYLTGKDANNTTYKISLPGILVQGRGAKRSQERSELATGYPVEMPEHITLRNGEKYSYKAEVETQEWMNGASLYFDETLFGCCSSIFSENQLIREKLNLWDNSPIMVEKTVVIPVEEWVPITLADTLSTGFPFVQSADNFDPQNPFVIYDDERENALIVYFSQGSSKINDNYRGNKQILINLTSVVSMIRNDANSDVEKIVIGGFASPEGSYQINDRLAFERGVAVKEHIVETTGMPQDDVLIYNGSVDWQGLRYMISKTNILERDQIIRIIDEVPVWDSVNQRGRLGELMRLNNGVTYRFLLSEYFPLLRNGAFIKVYYSNK